MVLPSIINMQFFASLWNWEILKRMSVLLTKLEIKYSSCEGDLMPELKAMLAPFSILSPLAIQILIPESFKWLIVSATLSCNYSSIPEMPRKFISFSMRSWAIWIFWFLSSKNWLYMASSIAAIKSSTSAYSITFWAKTRVRRPSTAMTSQSCSNFSLCDSNILDSITSSAPLQ